MEYRVTLTLTAPAVTDGATLAEALDRATDALVRAAPSSGLVVDAQVGEPDAHVTLTVDAPDVTEAMRQATRLIATALVPIASAAVEPVTEPARVAS